MVTKSLFWRQILVWMSSLHGVRKGCCFSPDALGDNSVWTPASVILGLVSKEHHVASRSIGADCKTNVIANRCIHNAELGSVCYIPPKISWTIPKSAVRYMYLVEESLMSSPSHFCKKIASDCRRFVQKCLSLQSWDVNCSQTTIFIVYFHSL